MALIQVERNTLCVSVELLQTPRVWAWVGFGWSPTDNDDRRVAETRRMVEEFYPHVPYGMFVGNFDANGAPIPIERGSDGYYRLDLSRWQAGTYRMNFHTDEGVSSSVGSPLAPDLRDKNVSWMPLERIVENGSDEDKIFLHREENGAGYSIRIRIWPDRSVNAFGDIAQSK